MDSSTEECRQWVFKATAMASSGHGMLWWPVYSWNTLRSFAGIVHERLRCHEQLFQSHDQLSQSQAQVAERRNQMTHNSPTGQCGEPNSKSCRFLKGTSGFHIFFSKIGHALMFRSAVHIWWHYVAVGSIICMAVHVC